MMWRAAVLALPCLLAGWTAPGGEATTPPKPESPAVAKELAERIRVLIVQLGDDDYHKREAASSALRRIGRPALAALEAATKDHDLERANRATELVEKVKKMGDLSKVNKDATNGYMPVYGNIRQVQTFKAGADMQIDAIRFRAARTINPPAALTVELREAGKDDGDPMATATVNQEWTNEKGDTTGVSRYFRWVGVKQDVKLQKGKTYRIIFASTGSGDDNPWLVNAFYKDTYPDGQHLWEEGGKAESVGEYDLVIELRAKDDVKWTTVPGKMEFPKDLEHFGVGHDGEDRTNGMGGAVGAGAAAAPAAQGS